MENFTILDTETGVVSGNELKGEDMENGSLIGNAPRKGLSDITNLQQQSKALNKGAKLLLQPASLRSKDYINKLQQENMTLMKVLADRNKVIELSGIELQKLRINLEKFQQQNLLLAQANSQMSAELNSSKDRLKILKHELGCKDAVLKAIQSEKKAKNVACLTSGDEMRTNKCDKAGESLKEEDGEGRPCNTNKGGKASESLKEEDGENKPCKMNRRRQSKSLCPSNIKPVQAKEGIDNKRVCLRRQSARFKAQEPELTEDAFDVDNTKFLVSSFCDDKVHESGPISSDSSVKKEHEEGSIDDKRVCLRRQSARFKAQEAELTEDAIDVDNTKFLVSSVCDDKVHENGPISSDSSVKKEHEEGSIYNKRRVCLRRQSARLKAQEPELTEDVFEVDDTKFLLSSFCDDKGQESGPISSDSSVKKEDEEGSVTLRNEAQELKRMSLGRPLRQAVQKVQSYKEIPLSVKMRREK